MRGLATVRDPAVGAGPTHGPRGGRRSPDALDPTLLGDYRKGSVTLSTRIAILYHAYITVALTHAHGVDNSVDNRAPAWDNTARMRSVHKSGPASPRRSRTCPRPRHARWPGKTTGDPHRPHRLLLLLPLSPKELRFSVTLGMNARLASRSGLPSRPCQDRVRHRSAKAPVAKTDPRYPGRAVWSYGGTPRAHWSWSVDATATQLHQEPYD